MPNPKRLHVVPEHKAVGWYKTITAAKAKIDDARAAHAAAFASIKDDPDYHDRAFKASMREKRMDPESRAEFQRKKDEYDAALGVREQLPLPLDDVQPVV